MTFRLYGLIPNVLAILIVIFALSGTSNAQLTVSINGPSGPHYAPTTGIITVTATVSANPDRIVFYRNDVPYKTISNPGTSPSIQETQLGQDTYTYRARVYDSQDNWYESNDFVLTVQTPRVLTMGGGYVTHVSDPSLTPLPTTLGPDKYADHSTSIEKAVEFLRDNGGGTLYFPCNGGANGEDISVYNVSRPITLYSNVTLQGESAEEGIYSGRCRIYWTTDPLVGGCVNPLPSQANAMFDVVGDKTRIRFRDLFIVSRILGYDCTTNGTPAQIEGQQTTAVRLKSTSHISDIIFENVSITGFTRGIWADGEAISDVKMRGVRTTHNYQQLLIDAYAYDWDVQNFNVSSMTTNQRGIEILKSGAPPSAPAGENKKLKFLQVNCAGTGNPNTPFPDRPELCVSVKYHRGLYFKQLHSEGVKQVFVVEDIGSGTNNDPIVLEQSLAIGEFRDDSMKLYLIGSSLIAAPDPMSAISQPHGDKRRMEFTGAGLQSTVVDCGDLHVDRTDVNGGTQTLWGDWKMSFTQTERNRGSLFLLSGDHSYVKKHTPCPQNDPLVSDINKVGGDSFNTGVLPVDTLPIATNNPRVFDITDCGSPVDCTTALEGFFTHPTNHGTIYIYGSIPISRTVVVPKGQQIVGFPGAELYLTNPPCNPPAACGVAEKRLLQIDVPIARVGGTVIRNLKLRNDQIQAASGLVISGMNTANAGASSDMHFSGLTFTGFNRGLEITPLITNGVESPHPMIDGLSWKNLKFVNNQTAAQIYSSNLSNWNVMNVNIESNLPNAIGWNQITSGISLQNAACKGGSDTNRLADCIRLDTASIHLSGLKRSQFVTNALTVAPNPEVGFTAPYWRLQYGTAVLYDNDFTSATANTGRVNVTGKTFITSMNNKYQYFNVLSSSEANYSRLTYCGDTYKDADADSDVDDNDVYFGLAADHPNLYVGTQTPTRVKCGARPYKWDDPVKWGAEKYHTGFNDYFMNDIPLTGNFYDDVKEDFVIYRPDKDPKDDAVEQSQFLIRKSGAGAAEIPPTPIVLEWGLKGDLPMTGKFLPNQRSQVVVWRPSTAQWYMLDPDVPGYQQWSWGLTCATVPYPDFDDPNINCDVPFIGNFIKDVDPNNINATTPDMDEIAIYRPGNKQIWIYSPQFGQIVSFTRAQDYGSRIQVGDFRGVGHDQIAQIKNGVWTVFDPRDGTFFAQTGLSSPQTGDKPVAGKYFSGACTQIAVWRPGTSPGTSQFIVMDPPVSSFPNCGNRPEASIKWGSNNDSAATDYYDTDDPDFNINLPNICAGGDCPNDIPLGIRVSTQSLGAIDRPVVYRPTKGAFKRSISNGQWWIHDPFGY